MAKKPIVPCTEIAKEPPPKTTYVLTIDEWKDGLRVSYGKNSVNRYLDENEYAAVMAAINGVPNERT